MFFLKRCRRKTAAAANSPQKGNTRAPQGKNETS
jgi:hypothetical protein